ncbi:cold-shock protein [Paenibacillus sp. GCM10027628]|uniref:cold-shock protein n=1 Tax=Paenibacillus sp. GCM10027628 TaxID=3273413 RepID=UPI0036378AB0
MYFSKKTLEPVQEEETSIWTCSTDQCSCWMRDNFSFDESPVCPICNSAMVKDMKMLPALTNTSSRR